MQRPSDISAEAPNRPPLSEDLAAIILGLGLLTACLGPAILTLANGSDNPLRRWIAKPGEWQTNVTDAFAAGQGLGLLGVFLISGLLFGLASQATGTKWQRFAIGFPVVFVMAVLAFVLASQTVVKANGFSYALWALVLGLLVSNTIGTPRFVSDAAQTELFIKTGLVVLGAEVLFSKLWALGLPGVCIAWIVTPIVLISTFWFGQRCLRIESPSLNMVISADMSVCGVSAAIATAAACRAKKEELSVAIGLSLTFTAIMMVLMPPLINMLGLSELVGGAWIGGTIDSTGAVGAAGAMIGDNALVVATAIKMIQNILIGVVAFGVALYWVTYQERPADDTAVTRPDASEIWRRFPKFVIGFLAASICFSLLFAWHANGPALVSEVIKGGSKTLRNWFFCLAFVSIGLQTNFRVLAEQFRGGKPLVLYVCGQTLNLCLTLLMAWIMFEKVFPGTADALAK